MFILGIVGMLRFLTSASWVGGSHSTSSQSICFMTTEGSRLESTPWSGELRKRRNIVIEEMLQDSFIPCHLNDKWISTCKIQEDQFRAEVLSLGVITPLGVK